MAGYGQQQGLLKQFKANIQNYCRKLEQNDYTLSRHNHNFTKFAQRSVNLQVDPEHLRAIQFLSKGRQAS